MGYNRFAAGTAAAVVALGAPAAAFATPIPSVPGPVAVPRFVGAPAVADPIGSFAVPQNPHLAPNPYNSMHDDGYGTNSYPGAGPLGHKPKVNSRLYGVEECATVTLDSDGRLVGLCINAFGPVLRLIDPTTLRRLAARKLPGRKLGTANPLTDLCGGAYFYLDQNDRAVVATTAKTIEVVADTGSALHLQRTYDVSSAVVGDDCLVALMPDWSGHIWFVTGGGVVGTVNPVTGAVHSLALPGEIIDNSFSVDETGGVFIVTDHALYRFDAGAGGAPVITWRQSYDRGSRKKPGQLAQGSGTTPTLLGGDLVAITDNADPRMNVLAFHRSTGAPVCGTAVFAPGASDTENSLVAVGQSVIVENNYGYKDPTATLGGKTTSPGIARVDLAKGNCTVAWTSQEIAPTSVPKASLANGLVYVYTKPAATLVDAWYLTAIDIRTGKTAFSQLTGTGPGYNNHYASIYLGPDGSAYIPTLTGMVRVHDTN
jgi:hypothetical protein